MVNLELKIPPVIVVAIAAIAMWSVAEMAPDLTLAAPGKPVWAVLLAAAGGSACLLGVVSFRKARTTVDPMHPESASSLVVHGIYNHTRNPMYAGFLFILLGWGVHLSNLLAFAVVPVFVAYMNCFQIIPEERALERRFGDSFREYRMRVRRWL